MARVPGSAEVRRPQRSLMNASVSRGFELAKTASERLSGESFRSSKSTLAELRLEWSRRPLGGSLVAPMLD